METTRREMLQGSALALLGFLLPALSRPLLTEADQAVLYLAHRRIGSYQRGPLVEIRVHKLLRERMNLSHIDGVPIQTIWKEPSDLNLVPYYEMRYGRGLSHSWSTSACSDYPDAVDAWVKQNLHEMEA